jgi:hypothetical protein
MRLGEAFDRAAGRIYTRILGAFTALVAVCMLIQALLSWRAGALVGGVIWLLGAVLFGWIARSSWRSRAAMSDVDWTG